MKFNYCLLAVIISFISINAKQDQLPVFKKVLNNGLTVLVREVETNQKVAIQVHVNVGSVHEETHEKGLAHLLEHMEFKGTENLTETDIDATTDKLSGDFNAMTGFDTTAYVFNFPIQHWKEALPILADCMNNCTFKQDLLNAEFKTVIQELKMIRDQYFRTLIFKMVSTIFEDHPYHYPIIGYKQDIWNINQEGLKTFYKKHYVPNNAVLIVVGNVKSEEVFALAEQHFGHIKKDETYVSKKFYYNKDLSQHKVTLYRDVQKSMYTLAYVIPGLREIDDYLFSVVENILVGGKSSRLVKKLLDELKIVNDINGFFLGNFDHGIYFIRFEPQKDGDAQLIIDTIQQELDELACQGPTEAELAMAIINIQKNMYHFYENNFSQAYSVGHYYWARGDENYLYEFLKGKRPSAEDIKAFVTQYFSKSKVNVGSVLPMNGEQRQEWALLQGQSDKEDEQFLKDRERKSEVESVSYAHKVHTQEPTPWIPMPSVTTMANGLKLVTYKRTNIPMIAIKIDLKAKSDACTDYPGLYQMMCDMMREGTARYTAAQMAYELESRGISLAISPGDVSMTLLKKDLEKGLELLNEILSFPLFEQSALDKIKNWAIASYKDMFDSPHAMANKIIAENLYKNHPYGISQMADEAVINSITTQQCNDLHKKVITPRDATVSIVGDFDDNTLHTVLDRTLGKWQGCEFEDIKYPELAPIKSTTIDYSMNRDQVVLTYAGLSVDRHDPDYHKLILFDSIFAQGLNSKLYQLRQKHGIFYYIDGSLARSCGKQKGRVIVSTQVSVNQLSMAEDLITGVINTVIDSITEEDLQKAKTGMNYDYVDWYSSNEAIASALLVLNHFNLPFDYYMHRMADIKKITLDQVKEAARKVLSLDKMITVRVGRI